MDEEIAALNGTRGTDLDQAAGAPGSRARLAIAEATLIQMKDGDGRRRGGH